jgi:hypothetical protein
MVGFVSRLSAASLSQETGTPESWIQVAVAGEFSDPGRYGDFTITAADLTAMAENFTAGKFPEPPTEICVDYDHLTLKVKAPGDGKAAGWFRQLETRANDAELWARVAWTEAGADAIRNGEYRYFSPVIRWDYTTNKGAKLAAVLFNGALTNTPFLQGMEPLALSAAVARGRDPLLVLAVITDNDKKARVDEAIRQRFASFEDRYSCWLVDTEGGNVAVFYDRGKYYRIGYAVGSDGSVSLLGEPVEAVINYPALSAHGGRSLMSKTILTLKAATGGDVQIDAEQLEQLDFVKQLRAKLPKDGESVVPASDLAALQANVAGLSTQVQGLQTALTAETEKRTAVEKALSLTQSGDAVDRLIREGKATPAERDALVELHQASPELYTKLMSTRTVIVPLADPKGRDGGPVVTTAETQLAAKATELRAATPALTPEKAMALAIEQNPSLYIQAEREAGR